MRTLCAESSAVLRRLLGTSDAEHRHVYTIGEPVLLRVRQPFSREPVRTLDAIHLATAMYHALEVAAPILLTVDEQVRANGRALGLAIAP